MTERIAIFGVGLIGGSFALAHKSVKGAFEIVGVDRSEETLAEALRLGVIDRAAATVEEALAECDLALLAVPVAQSGAVFAAMMPHLHATTIVTDAGSTKSDVVVAAHAHLGQKIGQFVPAHPISGRERHGPSAATADLYFGKKVVLTPLPENSRATVARVDRAWRICGAELVTMTPQEHDATLAAVSHLPHMLAYAMVAYIVRSPEARLKFDLAGGGFADFTRIAASSPEMWRDIALANRAALLAELDGFGRILGELREDVASGDAKRLESLFSQAQAARTQWRSK